MALSPTRMLLPYRTGLVGYWPFCEGGGIVAHDLSPMGNHGTLTGATHLPTWVAGKLGNAVQFDGIDDYVTMPKTTSLDITTGDLSIDCWFYCTAVAAYSVLVMHGEWVEGYIFAIASTTSISLDLNDGASHRYTWSGLADLRNAWHHTVVTANRTTNLAELFIDNVSKGTKDISATTGSITATRDCWIGDFLGYACYYTGIIDELRIFNRALTDAEVFDEYFSAVRGW